MDCNSENGSIILYVVTGYSNLKILDYQLKWVNLDRRFASDVKVFGSKEEAKKIAAWVTAFDGKVQRFSEVFN